jgi:hypothetical protein
MRTYIEKAVLIQLQAVGLKKLPPAVVAAIIDAMSDDMAAALAAGVLTLTRQQIPAKQQPRSHNGVLV